ncbi:RidA family protein [Niveispirillum sp.]|uniref:RidA family protein n=1 Tax=Niveispirillum sp. TaxID=1917217 RepID=UPI001B42D24D|nr:RidA family protein [Niveispirillum sp.]MBP7337246.1 RidA family protein [Niveispirillum sp.]
MNGDFSILQPPGWVKPKGYANGIRARGDLVVTGGQIGWNGDCVFETHDFLGQIRQALANVVAVVREAGGGPEHIVRLNWYVTDIDAYRACLKDLGPVYRDVMGRNFPAMTLVQVAGLVEREALVEIEGTAVVPC